MKSKFSLEQIAEMIEGATESPCEWNEKGNLIIGIDDNFQVLYNHIPDTVEDYAVLVNPEHPFINNNDFNILLTYRREMAASVFGILHNTLGK